MAGSLCPNGKSPPLLAAWVFSCASARDQNSPQGVLKALNQRSAPGGWTRASPSQHKRCRWMTANWKDPSAVQGPWAWGWGGQSPHLGGVAHLFWESRGAGLPHCWPRSSSKSSHPAGFQEWAERQLATDTALQKTKTRRGSQRRGWERKGFPQEGAQVQNKTPAAEGGKAASGDSLLPPCFRQSLPTCREASHSLSHLCLFICLSLTLGKISRCSLTRASLGHLLKHISHYRTKTFLCIEPKALRLDLHPISTCCQSRWKRQSSHLP